MNSVATEMLCLIQKSVAERIGESRYKTWFGGGVEFALEDERLSIVAPNAFVGNWIATNYLSQVREAARDVAGSVTVDVRVNERVTPHRMPPAATTPAVSARRSSAEPRRTADTPRLRGTLDSFVVGECNRLAHAAIEQLVREPTDRFRPLFLHGGCGLGKTHLLQALCNALGETHPTLNWCYLSGEEFTNEFIYAVKSGRIDAFRARFRQVELLVIDDIHFIANKKATQEEFLHTFNAIDSGGRTIVLSSDRHPRGIASLSEPLINRLVAGMVAEVRAPDFATRREILRRRAAELHGDVGDSVLDLIARGVSRNVRELEGALYKLTALAALTHEPITLDMAQDALREYLAADRPLDVPDIEREAGEFFGVTRERIHSQSRDRTVSLARAAAMLLVRRHTSLSYPEIGRAMGNKNHSTVVMAVQRLERVLAQDGEVHWKTSHGATSRSLRTVLDEIEQRLQRQG